MKLTTPEYSASEQTETTADAPGSPAKDGDSLTQTGSSTDWTSLVQRVQAGDPSGMEDLYRLFSRGIRFYLCRRLGPQELDDKVHDIYLIVVQAIRRGDLRDPARLMGFVRTIVRRQVAAHIDEAVHMRREQTDLEHVTGVVDDGIDPEERAIRQEKTELMIRVLDGISDRDREILTRFYLYEQTQEQICAAMSLTETQFRLLKSRAKARFGELGRRSLNRSLLNTELVRKIVGR